jgi:O-antigen ligase
VLAAVLVLINYYSDYEAITESIKQGQAIPTPFSRPNFSVVIAFGFLISIALTIDSQVILGSRQKYTLGICSVFLLLFLHILSVRSGLLVAYLGVIVLGLLWLVKTKNYVIGLVLAILLASIPVLSYLTIPSFKNKVDYSIYDIKLMGSNKGATYSDSERIYSIQSGWHVFKKNPLLGCGIGDLRAEGMRYYRSEEIQMLKFKYPHNQFIYILAAYGLVGMLLFLISIYGPLFVKQNYRNIYLILFYISMTSLFLVESPLGRANMLAFYILFVSIGMLREKT